MPDRFKYGRDWCLEIGYQAQADIKATLPKVLSEKTDTNLDSYEIFIS